MAALQFPIKKSSALEESLGSYDEGSMILPMNRKYVHETNEPASATNDAGFDRIALTGFNYLR
jgi:hypothetical protein